MRLLWAFVKLVIVLCLVVPIAIIALSISMGILGALVGLAIMALRLAVFGLLAYGAFRLVASLFGWRRAPSMPTGTPIVRDLPRPDPYLEAAKRELDQELGETSR
ncbi:MAG TPA: hypothetical protein VF483_02890 [Gemmatimonadaceae bacterium]